MRLGCLVALIGTLSIHGALAASLQCVYLNRDDTFNICLACYTIWRNDSLEVKSQGCWPHTSGCSSDVSCIHNSQLLQHVQDTSKSNLSVCCCLGPNCNANFNPDSEIYLVKISWIILLVITLLAVALAIFVIAITWQRLKRRKQSSTLILNKDIVTTLTKSMSNPEEKLLISEPLHSYINFDEYSVDEILQSGKFSVKFTLLQRSSEDQSSPQRMTLIKFSGSSFEKQLFLTEKLVYELLSDLKCNSFLKFYGGFEELKISGETHNHLIALEHVPRTLESFLKSQTIGWTRLTNILLDLSTGLAVLHSKRIVHRNITTANILIRSNLQCCIADFGMSQVLSPFHNNLSILPIEELIDVRYLAPEGFEKESKTIIEENTLKQMDIYTLALVFWELSRRCQDLYQGVAVPAFEKAFEKEIGNHPPSFEQMKILLRKRVRPLFPDVWKESNPAIQQLKETITDSWDDDGEARLNIETIVQRVIELDPLWMKYRLTLDHPSSDPNALCSSRLNNSIFVSNIEPLASQKLEKNPLGLKNDIVVSGQQPSVRIQPFQGLNPCLERNIQHVVGKVEEISNNFVTGSFKDKCVKPQVQPLRPVQTRQPHRRIPPPPIQYFCNDIGNKQPRKDTNANSKTCNQP